MPRSCFHGARGFLARDDHQDGGKSFGHRADVCLCLGSLGGSLWFSQFRLRAIVYKALHLTGGVWFDECWQTSHCESLHDGLLGGGSDSGRFRIDWCETSHCEPLHATVRLILKSSVGRGYRSSRGSGETTRDHLRLDRGLLLLQRIRVNGRRCHDY